MSSKRFSALLIADSNTFRMSTAAALRVKRRIWRALSALRPRIKSTTRRAFWGEVRRYLLFAVASGISISFLRLRRRRRCCCRRSRSARRSGRGCRLFHHLHGVSLEGAGRRKLAELVSHHVFGDVDGNEFPPLMHGNRVSDEIRKNRRAGRPAADHLLLVRFAPRLDLQVQV